MSEAKKTKSPKFRWTKELVNIALNDGMTQEEIARVCRSQQPVVSSWKNGKNKATVQQLTELLRRYGARLNRTTARVYLVYEPPTGTWQETEIGRRLLELRRESKGKPDQAQSWIVISSKNPGSITTGDPTFASLEDETHNEQPLEPLEQLRRAVYPYANGNWRIERLLEEYQESFEHEGRSRLVQVEGPVIFRYTFFIPVKRERPKGCELGREPVARWLLHDLRRGKLLLVGQRRRRLFGFAKQRHAEQLIKLDASRCSPPHSLEWIESRDDAGRWISFLKGPLTVEELLAFMDGYLRNPEKTHGPHDEQVLPYLLKKALVEHGHPVPGMDRITAFE